jgi:hypothetical protein
MTKSMRSDGSPVLGELKEEDRAHRRALSVGIGVSAALHLVVILVYSVVMTQWNPPATPLGVDSRSQTSNEMRVVQVVEIELPNLTVEPPEEPDDTPEARLEIPEVGPPILDPVELDAPPGRPRAAEVLRVRAADARLWRPAMPEAFRLTEAQRMQLQLEGRLEEWADSVALALDAEYALTDWTRTDDQGRRWGISPGQIHLGGITLPLPFYFGGNSIQREQAARRAWEDQDILNGANAQIVRSSWRERAEAIRRRADRNRNDNAAASDTTGSSGG